MKRILIVFLFGVSFCKVKAQDDQGFLQFGILVGGSGYAGDLTSNNISLNTIHPGGGVEVRYVFSNYFGFRGGINYSKVSGADKKSGDSSILGRNLSFETNILEVSACAEVNLLSPELFSVYPYLFAGVGYFYFNPYTYDNSGKKVFLRPLSTEGEGLPQYPKRKEYSLSQICIPLGAGIKWSISPKFDVGLEVGVRKLFTDYLDDVSGRYASYDILLQDRGPEAVELAYRGDGKYPNGGSIRGNSSKKDVYYTFGLKILYSLGTRDYGGRYGSPNRLY
jgi:hypothetical protein